MTAPQRRHPRRPVRPTPRGVVALVGVLALGATACSPGGEPGTTDTGAPAQDVTVLSQSAVAAWDPQRLTGRETAAFAGRTWMRTLTAHPSSSMVDRQRNLVGDLATNDGTASDGARTWRFTLRPGVSWQDGSDLTCADLVHGVARGFDPSLGGGSGYALAYLDIPKKPDGSSVYRGPFATKDGGPAAKAFANAVSCKGRTITYRLSEPVGDFDEMVALPEFAPVKKSQDRREDGLHAVFSSGPYRLVGDWVPGKGGTFERNPEWSAKSDPLRGQEPLRLRYVEDAAPEVVISTLMDSDVGRTTLVIDPVPRVVVDQARESAGDDLEVIEAASRVVDYLTPNHSRGPMRDPQVRWAFSLATDRAAYAAGLGGDSVARPVDSLLTRVMPSRHHGILPSKGRADVPAARSVLRKAGRKGRIKVRLGYRSDASMDTAMKALVPAWSAAGFDVTLKPLTEDYFATIAKAKAASQIDVFWSNWAADWPSASTVLPPLFDSRLNLARNNAGRNYGLVRNNGFNRAFDRASALPRGTKRAAAWSRVDGEMLRRGAYVPLAQHRSTYLAGGSLKGLRVNQALGGVLDLATLEVSP